MRYTVAELGTLFSCDTYERSFASYTVEHAETDSRSVLHPATTVFFALRGRRFNGEDFIPQLAGEGVRVFVVDSQCALNLPDACLLRVPSVLDALQDLAIHHRKQYQIPVVGITGSNGKTIVKEWLYTLLRERYRVCKNPKSYNSQLGVALSVLELDHSHDIALFEAGISQTGEMDRLREMIQPTHGLITNLGDAHQAGFSSPDAKAQEKMQLFRDAANFIYRKDYASIDAMATLHGGGISWSQKLDAGYTIDRLHKKPHGLSVRLRRGNAIHSFDIPFEDEASLENGMHCIVASLELGLSAEEIQRGLRQLHALRMRLEQKEGLRGCLLINDSYSLDLKSLQLALQFVDQQNQSMPRTLVVSDFAGQQADDGLPEGVAQLAVKYQVQKLIAVGPLMAQLRKVLDPKIAFRHFPDPEALLAHADALGLHDELVLIKGARHFRLERFFDALSLSQHDTTLEIDLKAVAHNLACYRSLAGHGVKCMAVVKAAAYGSGHYEIARLLEFHGVDYLAVAYPDEGIALRQKGIRLPILVLNPGGVDFNRMAEYRLEPEVYSIRQLLRLLEETGGDGIAGIHIKFDTGMHRLGFGEGDLAELASLLSQNPRLEVRSLFSHLAASDRSEHDAFTHRQASAFEAMSSTIQDVLPRPALRHLLNSGGLARHPQYAYDMVRLGIGLYGFDADPGVARRLEKVHSLKTRIAQVKSIDAGETVSYNRSGKLAAAGKIGVLSIGYADGLPRQAGEAAWPVWINRRRAPLVGNVCMDLCMVDLSGIEHCTEGMEVEVFGKNAPLEMLAEATGTIPYEILCRISGRVKRIFLQD